jgi:O-antigen/teichoic acid export membrane protein
LTEKTSDSLSKQALLLMAGRFLALPLNFLVPIILVRALTMEAFGIYKQLFMIFYILLPVIDLGICQSLFYFIPKYPILRDRILSQTFLLQIPIVLGLTVIFFIFRNEIGIIFSGSGDSLAAYIPQLGIFILLWHLSTIFENQLIVEKKAFQAGVLTFFSEALRAIVSIGIGLAGGSLEHLVLGLVVTGMIRCGVMGWYLVRNVTFSLSIDSKRITSQLSYALPFGIAVIIRTFFLFSHQYIVSVMGGASQFAVYAVGCFSLPFIAIIVDSVAKISLVKMSEATANPDSSQIISQIIYNSIRKLWLLFFPVYVLLFVMAEEVIVLLFTDAYLASIPVFRIFILMIPLSAFLVQHVPRALDQTRFILTNNLIALLLSILFSLVFYHGFGLEGAVAGFIAANVFWRIIFIVKCRKTLNVPYGNLLPKAAMVRVSVAVVLTGGLIYSVKHVVSMPVGFTLILCSVLFGLTCAFFYWAFPILLVDEKRYIRKQVQKYVRLQRP